MKFFFSPINLTLSFLKTGILMDLFIFSKSALPYLYLNMHLVFDNENKNDR